VPPDISELLGNRRGKRVCPDLGWPFWASFAFLWILLITALAISIPALVDNVGQPPDLTFDLAQESLARKAADSSLNYSLHLQAIVTALVNNTEFMDNLASIVRDSFLSGNVTLLQSQLQAETAERVSQFALLTWEGINETYARQDGDAFLAGNLTQETEARFAADLLLAYSIGNETLARQAEDTLIAYNLSLETAARQTTDNQLWLAINSNSSSNLVNFNAINAALQLLWQVQNGNYSFNQADFTLLWNVMNGNYTFNQADFTLIWNVMNANYTFNQADFTLLWNVVNGNYTANQAALALLFAINSGNYTANQAAFTLLWNVVNGNYTAYRSSFTTNSLTVQGLATAGAFSSSSYVVAGGVIIGPEINATSNLTVSGPSYLQSILCSTIACSGALSAGSISTSGALTAGSLTTGGALSVTGAITGGSITTGGTLGVSGTSTLGTVSAADISGTSLSTTGTLVVGDTSTLSTVNAGGITGTSLSTSGTLTVTGNTLLESQVGISSSSVGPDGASLWIDLANSASGKATMSIVNIQAAVGPQLSNTIAVYTLYINPKIVITGSNTVTTFYGIYVDAGIINAVSSGQITTHYSAYFAAPTSAHGATNQFALGLGGPMTSSSSISATGAITGGSLTASGGGTISTTGAVNGGAITGTSLTSSGTLSVSGTSTLGTVSGGAMTGTSLTSSGALSVTGTSTLGTVSGGAMTGTSLTSSGALSIAGTSTLHTVSGGAITGSSLTSSGALSVTGTSTLGTVSGGAMTGSSLTSSGALSVTGTSTLGTVSGGAMTGTSLTSSGALSVTGTSTLGTVSGGAMTGTSLTSSGALSVSGATTLAATTVNGAVTINAQSATTSPGVAIAGTVGTSDAGSLNIGVMINPVLSPSVTPSNVYTTVIQPQITVGSGKTINTAAALFVDSNDGTISGAGTISTGVGVYVNNPNYGTTKIGIYMNGASIVSTSTISTSGAITGGSLTSSGALSVTGTSTLAAVSAGSVTGTSLTSSGALSVTGTSTLGTVSAGAVTGTSLTSSGAMSISGAATLSSTLAVTSTTQLTGTVGINTSPATDVYLKLSGSFTGSSGGVSKGIFSDMTFAVAASLTETETLGIWPQPAPPSTFTYTTVYGTHIWGGTAVPGGTGTVTRGVNLYVENPAFGSTSKHAAQFTGEVLIGSTVTPSDDASNTNALYVKGNILATGSMTAASYVTSSDARTKYRIENLDNDGLRVDRVIECINSVQYHWSPDYLQRTNGTDRSKHYGFIAQQLQKCLPEAVYSIPDPGMEGGERLGFSAEPLISFMVKELQLQMKRQAKLQEDVWVLEQGHSVTITIAAFTTVMIVLTIAVCTCITVHFMLKKAPRKLA
jgi:hypothetical protein